MRLRILHETVYRYDTPASRAIQTLRLTPRGHDGQFVANWRIDIDRDCRLDVTTDPFGNVMHSFTVEGPLDGLTITAGGEVETQDTRGRSPRPSRAAPDRRLPPRHEPDRADAAIRDFAETTAAAADRDQIRLLHALMLGIRERLRFDVDATDTGTSAVEAFALRPRRLPGLRPHFHAPPRAISISRPAMSAAISIARSIRNRSPAMPGPRPSSTTSAGSVSTRPTPSARPRPMSALAVGLDYLGAAPVRGTRYGGFGESLSVRVRVAQAGRGGR